MAKIHTVNFSDFSLSAVSDSNYLLTSAVLEQAYLLNILNGVYIMPTYETTAPKHFWCTGSPLNLSCTADPQPKIISNIFIK
jgi:hypothetical protein